MKKPIIFKGEPVTNVVTISVPSEIINEYKLDVLHSEIIEVLDLESLKEYPDNEIGNYYASRDELVQGFYRECDFPNKLHEGAQPVIHVSYKEDGVVEFIFNHFVLSHDGRTVYAVYVYNCTMS